jgi:hypothetical protein
MHHPSHFIELNFSKQFYKEQRNATRASSAEHRPDQRRTDAMEESETVSCSMCNRIYA